MIFEFYIWIMAFLSTFLSVLWIIADYYYSRQEKGKVRLNEFPLVTVVVPVWNETKEAVEATLNYIIGQDYPRDKLEIVVVDDKGKGEAVEFMKEFVKLNNRKNGLTVKFIQHTINKGKAGAVNSALAVAHGDFFWVYDADSISSKELLRNMIYKFYEAGNEDVAAVVAITMIKNQGNWIEQIQRLEYVMTAFVRKLTGSINTLHTTNALSLFRTSVLKKAGGFDVGNLTEDFEIAMRLRNLGYRIAMCETAKFYTHVPSTIKGLWKQRVRWFRGFIANNLKYKSMVFNKELGLLGLFQIPLELFVLLSVFFSVILLGYNLINFLIDSFYKLSLLGWNIFEFNFPTLNHFILTLNWALLFPSLIVLSLGLYLYSSAHIYVKEKWKFYIPSILYLFAYPFFRSMQWLHAFTLEFLKAEKKW